MESQALGDDGGITPGTLIAGKYRLLARIAEGGMGAVWRAEDLRLGAPVAVKLLHSRDTNNPGTRARFEAEAAIAAQLRSPHVVQVFDVGVDVDTGAPFIVMELLDGESLQDRLLRAGPLAPAGLVQIFTQIGRALARAHELGIVHRDLKPSNIFLVRDRDVELAKVLDFGISKRTSHPLGRGRTVTGDLLGTPSYMSPEQILSSKDVDHRSDLWSLGVIAAECLTGRLPFDSDNLPGLALSICHGQAILPSKLGLVPAGFDGWFQRATQLQPGERFASATQLVDALRQVCGSVESSPAKPLREGARAAAVTPAGRPTPSVGPTTVPVARALERPRRSRVVLAALAALVLLIGAWVFWRSDSGRPVLAGAQLPAASLAAASGAEVGLPEPRVSSPDPKGNGSSDVAGVATPGPVDGATKKPPVKPAARPTPPAPRAKPRPSAPVDPDNLGF